MSEINPFADSQLSDMAVRLFAVLCHLSDERHGPKWPNEEISDLMGGRSKKGFPSGFN